MTPRILLPLILLFAACNGEDETGNDDTNPPEDTGPFGFTVKGTAKNLLTQQPVAEGLCVHAADPTAALAGGDLEILASGTVGAGGAYEVKSIQTDSSVGLLMLVQDCNNEGTVMPSATGMAASTYASLEDGDVISDYDLYSVDMGAKATFQAGLGAAGYTGDLSTDGALLGFVLDATGAPVGDAVVAGPKGTTTYYFTGKGFGTTGTVAGAARAMFIIPGAPVYSYTCTHASYTFDSLLVGSQPGFFVLVKFTAL